MRDLRVVFICRVYLVGKGLFCGEEWICNMGVLMNGFMNKLVEVFDIVCGNEGILFRCVG